MKPNENNARQSWVIDDIDDDDEDPNATPLTQQQNDPESANHGRRWQQQLAFPPQYICVHTLTIIRTYLHSFFSYTLFIT